MNFRNSGMHFTIFCRSSEGERKTKMAAPINWFFVDNSLRLCQNKVVSCRNSVMQFLGEVLSQWRGCSKHDLQIVVCHLDNAT